MKSLPLDPKTALLLNDPIYSQKNPHQTFLLAFSLFASAPLLFGGESASAALDREVTGFLVVLWGALLLVGSFTALVGEFWRGHTWDGLVFERLGLIPVAIGGGFYALVLQLSTHGEARYVVGVTAAYALSCAWRVVQITRRLRWLRSLISEVNARHEL